MRCPHPSPRERQDRRAAGTRREPRLALLVATVRGVAFQSYIGAVEALGHVVGEASTDQTRLAAMTGCVLPLPLPRVVAAAHLRDQLDHRINGSDPSPQRVATARQIEFLAGLAPQGFLPAEPLTVGVASAWISYYLALRSIACLIDLQLVSGDAVLREHRATDLQDGTIYTFEDEKIVSSIGVDGLVYFRGGNGQCAHPHRLRRP